MANDSILPSRLQSVKVDYVESLVTERTLLLLPELFWMGNMTTLRESMKAPEISLLRLHTPEALFRRTQWKLSYQEKFGAIGGQVPERKFRRQNLRSTLDTTLRALLPRLWHITMR